MKDPQKDQFHLVIQQLAATTEAPIRPPKGEDGFAHGQDSEGLAGGLTEPPQKDLMTLGFPLTEVRVHGSREIRLKAVHRCS